MSNVLPHAPDLRPSALPSSNDKLSSGPQRAGYILQKRAGPSAEAPGSPLPPPEKELPEPPALLRRHLNASDKALSEFGNRSSRGAEIPRLRQQREPPKPLIRRQPSSSR